MPMAHGGTLTALRLSRWPTSRFFTGCTAAGEPALATTTCGAAPLLGSYGQGRLANANRDAGCPASATPTARAASRANGALEQCVKS